MDIAPAARSFLAHRRLALVGVSRDSRDFSRIVLSELTRCGYDVVPVNPRESTVLGRTSYPNLSAIPGPIEVVNIFREPAAVPAIVEEAIRLEAKVIWMQLGVIHEEAAERASAAGLEVVMDRCMKIEHARFFGGLSTIGMNTAVITSRRRRR